MGGRIAWAECCRITNQPRFLATLEITILLCNEARINHKNHKVPFLSQKNTEIASTLGP